MDRIYAEDGTLLYEGETLYGKPYGHGTAYRQDGSICQQGTFGVKGIVKGRMCYPDGSTWFEGSFVINQGYGPNYPCEGRIYDESGKPVYEGRIKWNISGLGHPYSPGPFGLMPAKPPCMPFMWDDERRARAAENRKGKA